jgi:hypothetical protein
MVYGKVWYRTEGQIGVDADEIEQGVYGTVQPQRKRKQTDWFAPGLWEHTDVAAQIPSVSSTIRFADERSADQLAVMQVGIKEPTSCDIWRLRFTPICSPAFARASSSEGLRQTSGARRDGMTQCSKEWTSMPKS